MKYKFYKITWIDSETDAGWNSPEKTTYPSSFVNSYGFLIKKNKTYITLAADIDEQNNNFNRFIHIPIINIKSKKVIKL